MTPPIRLVGPSGELIDPVLIDTTGAVVGDVLVVKTGPVAGFATVLPTFQALTDGATITWTVTGKPSDVATVTLAGNRTLAITGAAAGYCGILIVKQDGTGTRTLALPSGSKVRDGGAGAIVLSTAASKVDVLGWIYDGTSYFWAYNEDFT